MTCVMSSQPLLAQETVNQSQAVQETIDQAGRQTQDRIDALSDKARAMLDEYRRAKDQAASLAVYNEQLARQVDSQTEELDSINRQLSTIDQTKRSFVPFMVRAIDTLDVFVSRDMPFLKAERTQRVARLRDLMGRADVTTAEQFRQIMTAYQTEIDYGRNIGTYEGKLALDGEPRTVQFLRVGRVALLYQTLDGRETGYWDADTGTWKPAPDYRRAVEHGINVASEQAPPDLLHVPLSAPQQTREPAAYKAAALSADDAENSAEISGDIENRDGKQEKGQDDA
ncbi:MAG: hypothetical protein CMP08_06980 [Xanthomonadales bacterium]|nr:hypothetical protein [Xanthomonadales bacterium]|tara:strand:- start:520 stop:1371 length:852 start_codon:yes stop_codon:yes gene_type:complete